MFYKLHRGYISSIYNTRIRCFVSKEIVLIHKVQNVKGTCDEKLPYTVHSLLNSPIAYKILVIEGAGWREASLDWLENMLMFESVKLFFSLEEANQYLQEVQNATN